METSSLMKNSYFQEDLDVSRCNIFHIFFIYMVHRIASLFRTRYLFIYPHFKEILLAFLAHRLFYVFHFLFNLRNLVRKLKTRVLGL